MANDLEVQRVTPCNRYSYDVRAVDYLARNNERKLEEHAFPIFPSPLPSPISEN